jgi:FkbM family methyltransferase
MERLRWLYRALRYRYKLERQEIRLVLDHLAEGDVAVDVGAHKGAYTYWMQRAVGPGGEVFAFEPQPELARSLVKLVRGGGRDNVTVENAGVSSSAGTMMLNVPGAGSSPGASFETAAGSDGQAYPVRVVTLDGYFAPDVAGRVRLIKCDAEGHELEVFRGAEALLRLARPVLLFECERRHRPDGEFGEVFSWLERMGYRGYYIDRRGVHDIEGFDPAVHQAPGGGAAYVNNFLFLGSGPDAGRG